MFINFIPCFWHGYLSTFHLSRTVQYRIKNWILKMSPIISSCSKKWCYKLLLTTDTKQFNTCNNVRALWFLLLRLIGRHWYYLIICGSFLSWSTKPKVIWLYWYSCHKWVRHHEIVRISNATEIELWYIHIVNKRLCVWNLEIRISFCTLQLAHI